MTVSRYMPPEWARHQGCLIAWPVPWSDWPVAMESVYRNFAEVIEAIQTSEPVLLVVDPSQIQVAKRWVAPATEIIPIALDDSWMRDMGPTLVYQSRGEGNTELAGVDWVYNGWGKFPHSRDQLVAAKVLDALQIPRVASDLVNEGGAIHVNGSGLVLATDTVQLNANRNPGWSKARVEQELLSKLGGSEVVWLPEGIQDDDTDGHVDEVACFTQPDRALILAAEKGDENQQVLEHIAELLRQCEQLSHPNAVDTLMQPPAKYLNEVRLSRSYVNFYVANQCVVMPNYGEADFDRHAMETVAAHFPGREVIPINCDALVCGGGNIHCITQQIPLPSPETKP